MIYHDQAMRAEKKGALDKSTVLYAPQAFILKCLVWLRTRPQSIGTKPSATWRHEILPCSWKIRVTHHIEAPRDAFAWPFSPGIAPTNYLEAQNWLLTTGRMSQEAQNKLGGEKFFYFFPSSLLFCL